MQILLIIGCGYSGLEIAKHWDGEVAGTTRTRQSELRAHHIDALDLNDATMMKAAIQAADAILLSAPPPDPAMEYASLIAKSQAWLGYLSTSAVYGDFAGQWVDENAETHPASERGELRLETERFWQKIAPRVNIFRLAGIYGPGRGPLIKIRRPNARKVIKKEQVFSRIHVADIARVVLASYEVNDQSEVYNLCDDLPAPPQDVLDYAADRLGIERLPETPFETAELSPMARSFYGENKRLSNAKIRGKFGAMLYPNYQAGIDADMFTERKNTP